MEINYRSATLSDVSMLKAFIEAAFRASDTRPGWTGDLPQLNEGFTISVESVQASIDKPDSAIIIASSTDPLRSTPGLDSEPNATAGNVVACFEVSRRSATLARFSRFVVGGSYQQRGIGRRILAYAEDYVQRTWPTVDTVEMDALSNRAVLIEWYVRNGYRRTGVMVPFPVELHTGSSLPKDLCFVMLEKKLGVHAAA